MLTHKFEGFGKEFAKSQKLSPDALIQVSIQLAYHRYVHSYKSVFCLLMTYG